MQKPSIIVSLGDLMIVLLYGAGICYVHHFVHPLSITTQLFASGLLAFFLGSFGPQVEDIVEWLIFFVLGALLALLSPQILHYWKTGAYEISAIIETVQNSKIYILQLISPWTFMLPLGFVFNKISHRGNYYRHARFY